MKIKTKKLKAKLAEVKKEVKILRKQYNKCDANKKELYAFIKSQEKIFPISNLFEAFTIAPSTYYDYCKRPESKRAKEEKIILAMIKKLHKRYPHYGSPRIHKELLETDISCCENRVARIMSKYGIRATLSRQTLSR